MQPCAAADLDAEVLQKAASAANGGDDTVGGERSAAIEKVWRSMMGTILAVRLAMICP